VLNLLERQGMWAAALGAQPLAERFENLSRRLLEIHVYRWPEAWPSPGPSWNGG
jgi:hypothetical protein